MTDEEILFDLLTIEATREIEMENATSMEPEPTTMTVLPQTQLDGNRTSNMYVSADRAEFIRWYEAEIGPWQT